MSTTSSHIRAVFHGIPSFLRAQFRTSRRGGNAGYADAGRQLGKHVNHLVPFSVEEDEWLALLDAELDPITSTYDEPGVLAWLDSHFPVVMAEVPRNRRDTFVTGFFEGVAERDD